MRFFSQSFLYECVLLFHCPKYHLISHFQRFLVNRCIGLFPSLSKSLRVACHLVRCHFSWPHTVRLTCYHSPYSQEGGHAKMVSEGHSIQSWIVGYWRKRSWSIRQSAKMRHQESGSRQGYAGGGISLFCSKCRRVCRCSSGLALIFLLLNIARKTLQHTEARIVSRFGWGLTKKIENHGLSRFKANMQRVRRYSTVSRIMCWFISSSLAKVWVLFSASLDSHDFNPWLWGQRMRTQACRSVKTNLKSVKANEGLSGANSKLGFILHRPRNDKLTVLISLSELKPTLPPFIFGVIQSFDISAALPSGLINVLYKFNIFRRCLLCDFGVVLCIAEFSWASEQGWNLKIVSILMNPLSALIKEPCLPMASI